MGVRGVLWNSLNFGGNGFRNLGMNRVSDGKGVLLRECGWIAGMRVRG